MPLPVAEQAFKSSSSHQVFDRFFQAQNKHRKGKHAGLGLAIVKQILELHQCQIVVTSELGKGTQFTFSLSLIS